MYVYLTVSTIPILSADRVVGLHSGRVSLTGGKIEVEWDESGDI